MKYKNAYLIFSLLFIPIYIFHAPVVDYIHNFNKITYSLSIPENNIKNSPEEIISYKELNISDDIPLRQVISESWIISFPNINTEKLLSSFTNDLKKIGITSLIKLKPSDKNELIAIGPFIDKEIAEKMLVKINNSLGYSGIIKRLNN